MFNRFYYWSILKFYKYLYCIFKHTLCPILLSKPSEICYCRILKQSYFHILKLYNIICLTTHHQNTSVNPLILGHFIPNCVQIILLFPDSQVFLTRIVIQFQIIENLLIYNKKLIIFLFVANNSIKVIKPSNIRLKSCCNYARHEFLCAGDLLVIVRFREHQI